MEKKKKTKNKKRFTWVNLAQLLTVAALLLWMQWAVDSGRVLTIFVASPTSIVEEGIKIITDGTLWPHLLLTIQEALAGYLSAVVVGIAVGLLWTLFPVSEKYMNVFCSAIMAVPKVAILPLLILWFVLLFSIFTSVTTGENCILSANETLPYKYVNPVNLFYFSSQNPRSFLLKNSIFSAIIFKIYNS